MRNEAQIRAEAWAASLPGVVSFVGSAFIVVSVALSWKLLHRYRTLSAYVLKLSACDMAFSALIVAEFMPPALMVNHGKPVFHTHPGCSAMATVLQFAQLASFGWYTAIGLHTLRTLRSVSDKAWVPPVHHWLLEHVCVWGGATVGALIPVFGDAYAGDPDSDYHECWIPGNRIWYRATFYVPLMIALCLSLYLVLYTCKLRRALALVPGAHLRMVLRSCAFLGVFLICWTAPLLDRAYELASGHESPYPLEFAHAVTATSFGFGNTIVWCFSRPFQVAVKPRLCRCGSRAKSSSSSLHLQSSVVDIIRSRASSLSSLDDPDGAGFDTEDELYTLLSPTAAAGGHDFYGTMDADPPESC